MLNKILKDFNKAIPKNICQLFSGVFMGMLLFIIIIFITAIVGAVIVLFRIIQIPIAFLSGYLPNYPEENFGNILFEDNINRFKPYQCYGKNNEKKWIAPWKIVIPAVMLIFYKTTWKTAVVSAQFTGYLLTTKAAIGMGIAIASIIVLLVAISFIYHLIRKAGIGTATKEFFKSLKNRACLRVVPSDADAEQ